MINLAILTHCMNHQLMNELKYDCKGCDCATWLEYCKMNLSNIWIP